MFLLLGRTRNYLAGFLQRRYDIPWYSILGMCSGQPTVRALAIPSTSKTKLPPLGRFALANLPSGSVFAGNLLESNYRDVCVADIWMKPSFLKLFLNHGYETN
jgi:hypothetical protein